MKIEDAIKQKEFQNEFQKLFVNIMYSNSWIMGKHQKTMKAHGITVQQYNVLRILRGQKGNPISVNEITVRMIDKMSNSSRLVEKLRQKEFVERVLCEKDRRQVDIFITKKGLDLLKNLDQEVERMDEQLGSLSSEEAEQLNHLLDKMRSNE